MKSYDEKAPSKYIMYLDANNLYGWVMSQYLPTGRFRWMSDKKIKILDSGKYNESRYKGLILEIDLEYPTELHENHNSYPPACEKLKVPSDMLSDYCKYIASKYNISTGLGKNAKNAFEKDFFKLMNNSLFGKKMEHLRKRVDVRLIADNKRLVKLTSKPKLKFRNITYRYTDHL